MGLSRWHSVKELPENAWDTGDARDTNSIPGSGRSPVVGNGNPLYYSCLQNSMDRGAWQAIVHGAAKSRTQLSDWAHTHPIQEKIYISTCRESWREWDVQVIIYNIEFHDHILRHIFSQIVPTMEKTL